MSAPNPHAVVVAEDLANYGFDVTYDDALRKISIKENAQKAKNPIALDIYKNRNGQKAFSVKDSNITVALETSGGECILSDVYNVGGYTCISIDELANYFNFEWERRRNDGIYRHRFNPLMPSRKKIIRTRPKRHNFGTFRLTY